MLLLKHQHQAIQNFNGYAYLAWETGTGKTLTALKIAENFNNTLILCPASVINVWQNEIEKWGIKLRHYKLISYDKFRRHYQQVLRERIWNFLIFDEAHKLKSIKAQITKLVMKLFTKNYKCMLSGTPFEKPADYYTQLRILTYTHPFYKMNYNTYKNTFFDVDTMFHYIIDFKRGMKQKFLQEYVLPYVSFVRRNDVVELPSLIEDDKVFSDRCYLFNEEQSVTFSNILQEFLYRYKKSSLLKAKIEYVCDFISDYPNTLVFSHFIEPINQILKRIPRKKVYVITGNNKYDLEYAIKYSDKPILATFCISEGINLTQYKNVIFLSLPLAWRTYEQALSRVWRYGQQDKVYLIRLFDKNGIDQTVWSILRRKGDVLEELKQLSQTGRCLWMEMN